MLGLRVTCLVRGNEVKRRFAEKSLPEDMTRTVETYGSAENNIAFVELALTGATLQTASALAETRDCLVDEENVKVLRDDPTAKYCSLLYPRFLDYECGLRAVFTVAMCTNKERFDDERIADLRTKATLEALDSRLFYDESFGKKVRSLGKQGHYVKNDYLETINALADNPIWNDLFNAEDMPTVRAKYNLLKDYRNDVMHFHQMNGREYDSIRKLVIKANEEIQFYLASVQSGMHHSETPANGAAIAAKKLLNSYNDVATILAGFDFGPAVDIGKLASTIWSSDANGALLSQATAISGVASSLTRVFDEYTPIADSLRGSLIDIHCLMPDVKYPMPTLSPDAISTVAGSVDTSQIVGGLAKSVSNAMSAPIADEPDSSQEKGPDSEDPEP